MTYVIGGFPTVYWFPNRAVSGLPTGHRPREPPSIMSVGNIDTFPPRSYQLDNRSPTMPVESNAPSVPSDKDAILSAPRDDGANVLLTANRYDDPEHGRHGAIIEETSAFRSDIELFYDLHTLAWNADEEHTLDARDDAVESDVSYASSKVPEITLENRFDEPGSTGALTQRVVASVDTCGLLIETDAEFETVAERTIYTVADLGIHGHDHE